MNPVRYVRVGRNVIAMQKFAGSTIKAVASCDPNDAFDFEFGKKLAKMRLDLKVAKKRYAFAVNRQHACYDSWVKICEHLTHLTDSVAKRACELETLKTSYDNLMDQLYNS